MTGDRKHAGQSRVKKVVKDLVKWLAAAVVTIAVTVIIAVGVVAALLRDADGRVWLLHSGLAIANRALDDIAIHAHGVSAPELGSWRFDRLRIVYQRQLLLELNEAELVFDWEALRDQQLAIERLKVKSMAIHAPATDDATPDDTAPDAAASDGNGQSLAAAIDLRPWQITVAAVAVEQLQWIDRDDEQPLPAIALSGQFALWQNDLPWQGQLAARTLATGTFAAQPETRLTLSTQPSAANSADNSLHLRGSIDEPAGGWLGQWLALPADQALAVEAELDLQVEESGYDIALTALHFPWQAHDVTAAGELRVNHALTALTVRDGRLTIDGRPQRISGFWRGDDLDLDAVLDRAPLMVARPWLPMISDGWVSGALSLQGNVADPAVIAKADFTLVLKETDQRWEGQGHIDGRLQSSRLSLKLSRLTAHWRRGEQVAEGRIAVQGDVDFTAPRLDLRGNIDTLDSELVFAILRRFSLPLPAALEPLSVTANASEFAIRGPDNTSTDNASPDNEWRNVQLHYDGAVKGRYADIPLQLALDAEGSWQRFKLRTLRLQFADARINARGEVDLFGTQNDFSLEVDAFSTETFSTETLRAIELPYFLPPQLTATVSGEAKVSGALSQPDARFNARAEVNHAALENPVQLDWKGYAQSQRIVFETLNMRTTGAEQSDASLHLSGEMDIGTAIPAMAWQLEAEAFPLALLSAWGWPDVGGRLTTRLELVVPGGSSINADWIAKGQVTGNFDYHSGDQLFTSVGEKKTASTYAVRWQGSLADDETAKAINLQSLLAFVGAEQKNAGTINAQVDKAALAAWLMEGQQLPAVALQTQLELRVINFLLPQGTDLDGQLAGDISIAGTVSAPQVQGQLSLDRGRFASMDLGITLQPITATAKADGQAVRITSLRAEDGRGGYLEGDGHVDWRDVKSSDAIALAIRLNNLNLIEREEIDGAISGQLAWQGSLYRSAVSGDLLVEPLTISIGGGAPGADIPSIEVNYESHAEEEAASWLPALDLNVKVRAERRAYLRGRGLDAELKGQLLLQGTLEKPLITGSFDVVRGHFELFGNRFTLKDGNANFSNDSLALLVTGELNKGGRRITATLAGTTEALDFTLTSDPSMPEDEILAWLLFGKSIDNISGAQALQLATAISTLRGGGFDPVGTTRDILGVDTLTLDTQETETGTGVSIGAGKYLTERVYLELERSSDPTEPWRSNLTIELTPRLSLRSTLSAGTGSEGVELEWRRDY